jgi:GT2 family glycosyltransferase
MNVESVPTLIVVPVRAESAEQIEPFLQTLVSITATAPDAMVLVVDDRSPAPQAQLIEVAAAELNCAYVVQQDGAGRLAAFNVGLSVALEHEMDICFVSPGLILDSAGWLDRLRARTGTDKLPAAVVGGPIVESTGTIRQAGYFFSRFRREWHTRLANVPEAVLDVEKPVLCPVGEDLLFVRREWIERVTTFDEQLDDQYAALDYCVRISEAGGQSVLEPTVKARALTPRDGELQQATPASEIVRRKHSHLNLARWAPEVI